VTIFDEIDQLGNNLQKSKRRWKIKRTFWEIKISPTKHFEKKENGKIKKSKIKKNTKTKKIINKYQRRNTLGEKKI
jgi:hypothetical protein